MSAISRRLYTKEQLFDDLEKDEITLSADIIRNAKNGDVDAITSIGIEYDTEKQNYDKAMAWYRLSAVKNNTTAQNNIGTLYGKGQGVPRDRFIALEWYIKSAIQDNKDAWRNIANYFEFGNGVPIDKYKALEWYNKCGTAPDKVIALENQGIRLTQQDIYKPMYQLMMETEDIFWQARSKREDELREQISQLNLLKAKVEDDSTSKIKTLEEEVKTFRVISEHKQQEIDHQRASLEQYKQQITTMNNKMQSLKAKNNEQVTQLDLKDILVRKLEGANERINEVEQSNKNLKELLEQERRMKNNEVLLIKQEIQVLQNEEKEEKRKLEKENQVMKNELIRLRAALDRQNRSAKLNERKSDVKNDVEHDDPINDINYDTDDDKIIHDSNASIKKSKK